jgi:hypothetical protein
MSGFDERTALGHACPACGAEPDRRCRELAGEWMAEKYGRPRRYRHVKPHSERIRLAWRQWEGGEDA